MSFEGKTAVVTGGARGIGAGCARALLSQGTNVLLADVDIAHARETAQALSAEYPGRVVKTFQVNTRHQSECMAMADYAVRELGRIDILINSAGITSQRPSLDVTEEDWNNLIGINLSGVFFCSQAAARAMIAGQHGGAIISLSSIASEAGLPRRASYTAAKAGINTLTRTLAVEWAVHGIRVNAVAPGWVATELTANAVERGVVALDKLAQANPMQRIAEVEDIASAILFLAYNQASYITGQTLFVDGGLIAGSVAAALR